MNEFKYKQFNGVVILWTIRWYLKYGVSYRELEEILKERGGDADHTITYYWIIQYSAENKQQSFFDSF
ncbi:hypothetical protein fh0823_27340 [Francisella halioticida]|uniref:IS6 family transposase n=1 Tax=Francisella halioticida TaxID=549298 RepID=A0ABM6LXN0_9GAMM|nr:hypothetical protein [Francisella halioticida]ASG67406.1 hypothetical protein CDV26_02440 [Francisella halioticida]BCD92595.1 hypothetical protein fh0823_27340 [Francisella halioticida]